MMLKIKCQTELADPVADDPDPNLAVAEGLPCFRSIEVGSCLVKAGNDPRQPERTGAGNLRLQPPPRKKLETIGGKRASWQETP